MWFEDKEQLDMCLQGYVERWGTSVENGEEEDVDVGWRSIPLMDSHAILTSAANWEEDYSQAGATPEFLRAMHDKLRNGKLMNLLVNGEEIEGGLRFSQDIALELGPGRVLLMGVGQW